MTLAVFSQALEVRLADLARGFEEATIDKNEQEDKTIKMRKILDTAAQLRRVSGFICLSCCLFLFLCILSCCHDMLPSLLLPGYVALSLVALA